MVFNNIIMKGEPTNVRKVDISDALPGLTDAQRKCIREKASSDAIHLLGLQSHPHTSPPSPTGSSTPQHSPPNSSRISSREPSEALLNAASRDLPSALPTPPRRMHSESSPPAARMKTMKYSSPGAHPTARRLSFSSASSSTTDNSALFEKIKESSPNSRGKGRHESFMTLNLEFDWEDKNNGGVKKPRNLDLSNEGFEVADTVGGGGSPHVHDRTSPLARNKVTARAITSTRFGRSSDSASDSEDEIVDGERSPLVKI